MLYNDFYTALVINSFTSLIDPIVSIALYQLTVVIISTLEGMIQAVEVTAVIGNFTHIETDHRISSNHCSKANGLACCRFQLPIDPSPE